MTESEQTELRRKLRLKYSLPEDVAAALGGTTPEQLEHEAIRWSEVLRTGAPIPATTEEMLAKAKQAGADRVVRLLSPDPDAPANDVDHEAVEAATNAAEIAAIGRRRRAEAEEVGMVHGHRVADATPESRSGPDEPELTVADLVRQAQRRRLEGAGPNEWTEVDRGE